MSLVLKSDLGTFGPFSTVATLPDRYIADGVVWFFTACGPNHRVEPQGDWTPPASPLPVPTKCTGLQARFALNASGDRATVEALVAASPQTIKDYWHESSEFFRAHPVMELMRVALGWSVEKMDDLFREAAAINVDLGGA